MGELKQKTAELTEKKREFERAIADLIDVFEQTTGLFVGDIGIKRKFYQGGFGEPLEAKLDDVKIVCVLDPELTPQGGQQQ